MIDDEHPVVRPRVAAGVLFLDRDGRVLLVEPSYKPFLDLPGGFVEPGETPSAAAAREVREELGITPPIGGLLVADWRQDSADGDGGPKLLLVFDGGTLSSDDQSRITVDGQEIIGCAYHHVADLPAVTIPRLVTRIEQAVAAQQEGAPRYLEDGNPSVAPERG